MNQRTTYGTFFQFVIVLLGLMLSFASFSQSDSIKYIQYTPDFKFDEGLYLDFEQVKNNHPIPKNRIITNLDITRIDFFDQLLKNESIFIYDDNGIEIELEVIDLWGFCKSGVLFINYNDEFRRIPVVGSICHFVSNYKVVNSARSDIYNPYTYYDPFSYYPPRQQSYVTKEMRQYILDWESGSIYPYNYKSLKIILMNDPELYEEYNALRKRKQKQLVFFFMRKYNERNPLMIPLYKENKS